MQTKHSIITVTGTYFWELVFEYDNPEGNEDFKYTWEKSTTKSIDRSVFIKKNSTRRELYKLDGSQSVGISVESIGQLSSELNYSAHIDTARDITKEVKTSQTYEEKEVISQTYTIKGGISISLYRLCYVSDGIVVKTDIVSTNHSDNVNVPITYNIEERILGLDNIANILTSTRPKSENKREWEVIRDRIISSSDKSEEDVLLSMVSALQSTSPKRDNKKEWKSIRETCSEISSSWATSDRQYLFIKLVTRLANIHPGRSNKSEWEKIRKECNDVLTSIQRIF